PPPRLTLFPYTTLFRSRLLALPLLGINILAYGVLCFLILSRLGMYPRRVLDDFCDHGRGAGFFTLVAGTCVLGVQILVVAKNPRSEEHTSELQSRENLV